MTNISSIFQANAYDILNTYFIKYLLHVSVCYTLSSWRTSYYLLMTIPSLTESWCTHAVTFLPTFLARPAMRRGTGARVLSTI